MADSAEVYLLDADVLVNFGEQHDIESVVTALSPFVESGRVKTLSIARDEVRRKFPAIGDHIDGLPSGFVESHFIDDETVLAVGQVGSTFPRLQQDRFGTYESADPWLVAVGWCRGWVVVTDEKPVQKPNRKIPTACDHFGVRCIDRLGVIQELGICV